MSGPGSVPQAVDDGAVSLCGFNCKTESPVLAAGQITFVKYRTVFVDHRRCHGVEGVDVPARPSS